MGGIMTSQIIISDRHDGVWDRSIVAGVTALEITLTHFALQVRRHPGEVCRHVNIVLQRQQGLT